MGYIYIIKSTATDKVYIGQTTKTISQRWYKHKADAKLIERWINGDPTLNVEGRYNEIQNNILYNEMAYIGIDTFSIEIIEEMEDHLLNDAEVKYIAQYNSLHPNGLNSVTGGGSKYHHLDKSIKLMKQIKRMNIENNRHEILRGMPPYVSYGKNDSKGGEWIMVQNHPKCRTRNFYTKKYGSIEKVKEAVITFLAELESSDKVYSCPKVGGAELKKYPGLKETKKGYKIEKHHKGLIYRKGFESSKFSREENKQRAIDYYEQVVIPNIRMQSND